MNRPIAFSAVLVLLWPDLARQAVPALSLREIEGNHFFFVSKREATFGAIKTFMKVE